MARIQFISLRNLHDNSEFSQSLIIFYQYNSNNSELALTRSKSEIELKSEVGVDYSKLKELLSKGKWKEADEETYAVMLKASRQEKRGWLDINSIDKFPCADLRTIDQLWIKYSDGRFGFSIQKKIYLETGNLLGKYKPENFDKFGEEVGWKLQRSWGWNRGWLFYEDLTFNPIESPKGHLLGCTLVVKDRVGFKEEWKFSEMYDMFQEKSDFFISYLNDNRIWKGSTNIMMGIYKVLQILSRAEFCNL